MEMENGTRTVVPGVVLEEEEEDIGKGFKPTRNHAAAFDGSNESNKHSINDNTSNRELGMHIPAETNTLVMKKILLPKMPDSPITSTVHIKGLGESTSGKMEAESKLVATTVNMNSQERDNFKGNDPIHRNFVASEKISENRVPGTKNSTSERNNVKRSQGNRMDKKEKTKDVMRNIIGITWNLHRSVPSVEDFRELLTSTSESSINSA